MGNEKSSKTKQDIVAEIDKINDVDALIYLLIIVKGVHRDCVKRKQRAIQMSHIIQKELRCLVTLFVA